MTVDFITLFLLILFPEVASGKVPNSCACSSITPRSVFFRVAQYLERTWPLQWGTLLFYVCWILTGRTRGLWRYGASGIKGSLYCLRELAISSSHLRQSQIFHVCFPTLHLNVTTVRTGSPVDINWSASTTLPGDVSSCTIHYPYMTVCQFCLEPCPVRW